MTSTSNTTEPRSADVVDASKCGDSARLNLNTNAQARGEFARLLLRDLGQ